GDLGGEPAERLAGGVDDVPVALAVGGSCDVSLHEHETSAPGRHPAPASARAAAHVSERAPVVAADARTSCNGPYRVHSGTFVVRGPGALRSFLVPGPGGAPVVPRSGARPRPGYTAAPSR